MRVFKSKQEIKNERDQVKDPVIINLLKVILGELDRLPTRSEPSEDQIYAIIKKMYESACIMLEHKNEDSIRIERDYLKDFIKTTFTESQLEEIIIEAIHAGLIHNIGETMKFLKTNYNGQYDGKMASVISKKLF